MNSKLLLVIGTILAMVIAVGCSNNGRTTAPSGADNTLSLPNDNAASRFSSEQAQATPEPFSQPLVTRVGFYDRTDRGCQTLKIVYEDGIGAEEYVELTFSAEVPKNLGIGDLILVKGRYYTYPNTECMIPSLIEVQDIYILGSSHTNPGEEGPQL